jgi:hypothetical protein
MVGGTAKKVNEEENYCSLAYSTLACFRRGMSDSSSHTLKVLGPVIQQLEAS